MASALGDLTSGEQAELAALRSRHPDFDPRPGERVACAALLAVNARQEPMPPGSPRRSSGGKRQVAHSRGMRRTGEYTPVWFAAAATLILAAGIWVGRWAPLWEDSIATQRTELLASGRCLVRAEWAAAACRIAIAWP
jgi:hypothetical protein